MELVTAINCLKNIRRGLYSNVMGYLTHIKKQKTLQTEIHKETHKRVEFQWSDIFKLIVPNQLN